MRPRVLRVATRGSPLALRQTERFIERLGALPGSPRAEVVVVRTTGDNSPDLPIERIGGQGAFVKEVSAAVLDGRADVAVHSAKDLPSAQVGSPSDTAATAASPAPAVAFGDGQRGLVLAAVPERADPRDAVVGSALGDLGPGATVATGSVRRRAQLAWLRPDLTFCELRGNMRRRVERAEQVGAGVLALAGLERLGLAARVAEVLEPAVLLPQVGQGAIAVECRADDGEVLAQLAGLDDPLAHAALSAERAFLATLGGGCTLPCGALATPSAVGLVLEGMMASRDGHVVLRRRVTGADPAELGHRLATELLEKAGGVSLGDWQQPRAVDAALP